MLNKKAFSMYHQERYVLLSVCSYISNTCKLHLSRPKKDQVHLSEDKATFLVPWAY